MSNTSPSSLHSVDVEMDVDAPNENAQNMEEQLLTKLNQRRKEISEHMVKLSTAIAAHDGNESPQILISNMPMLKLNLVRSKDASTY